MNWLVFAASLAAILLLAGVAAWLKLGGTDGSLDDADAACRSAEAAIAGFAAKEALIGEDRRAALVIGRDARVAVIKAHGARAALREVRWTDIRAIAGGLRIETGERRFGTIFVNGVSVLDVRRAGGSDWRAN